MAQESSNLVQVAFAVGGLDTELHVLRATGQEGLSMLFRFELDLAAESNTIALDDAVGSPALLGLHGKNGLRYVHGVVSDFQQLDTQNKYTVYRATVVPSVWRMDQGLDCRIFQKQDVKTIVTKILKQAHVEHSFRVKGNRKLVQREYCVQYRESDWSFISRLLEEEGFYYYFEHTKNKHLLHVADGADLHPDIPAPKTVNVHAPDAMVPGEEHVLGFHVRQRLCPSSVMLNDFNFQKPSLNLGVFSEAKQSTGMDIYDYPGLYEVPESGKKLSGVRLEEARTTGQQAEGQSTCPRFSAGHLFTLDGHGREDLNQAYLLTRVLHRVEKSAGGLESGALDQRCSYGNSFLCIPAKVPFRPPRITPKPMVRGVQTAIVVGPDKEEIYTDEHGRVKVQFHWDREGIYDANSSCWIRVSQLWAGQGWGAMWIPRIGQEVIVDFLEGDPDRPIITGRVYHAQNPPPYALPKDKTKSTIKSNSSPGGKGFNELRFEDKKGAEEVFTHAQRDQNEVVRRNMTTSVGHDQSLSVGHDRTKVVKGEEKITVKKDQSEAVEGEQSLTVTKDRTKTVKANENITVKGNETITVKGNEDEGIGGTRTVSVGKDLKVTVTGTHDEQTSGDYKLKATNVKVDASSSVTITCGGATVTISGGNVDVKASGNVNVAGGKIKLN